MRRGTGRIGLPCFVLLEAVDDDLIHLGEIVLREVFFCPFGLYLVRKVQPKRRNVMDVPRAVEEAVRLTRQASESEKRAAVSSRQIAHALEDENTFVARFEQLKEEYKQKRDQRLRDMAIKPDPATVSSPSLADCRDSAAKARRKAKEQQNLADSIAKRIEENEGIANIAWNMALEVAQKVVGQWLEAAEAWETVAELYEKKQDAK